MMGGYCFGKGCERGPKGQHVVQDYGDNLWCIVCDETMKAEGELWWRHSSLALPADYMEITG